MDEIHSPVSSSHGMLSDQQHINSSPYDRAVVATKNKNSFVYKNSIDDIRLRASFG